MEAMKARVEEQAASHKRDIFRKDAEREIILDDLDRMSDQYQKLNMKLEDQSRKLELAQVRVCVCVCACGVVGGGLAQSL